MWFPAKNNVLQLVIPEIATLHLLQAGKGSRMTRGFLHVLPTHVFQHVTLETVLLLSETG